MHSFRIGMRSPRRCMPHVLTMCFEFVTSAPSSTAYQGAVSRCAFRVPHLEIISMKRFALVAAVLVLSACAKKEEAAPAVDSAAAAPAAAAVVDTTKTDSAAAPAAAAPAAEAPAAAKKP